MAYAILRDNAHQADTMRAMAGKDPTVVDDLNEALGLLPAAEDGPDETNIVELRGWVDRVNRQMGG